MENVWNNQQAGLLKYSLALKDEVPVKQRFLMCNLSIIAPFISLTRWFLSAVAIRTLPPSSGLQTGWHKCREITMKVCSLYETMIHSRDSHREHSLDQVCASYNETTLWKRIVDVVRACAFALCDSDICMRNLVGVIEYANAEARTI